MAKTLISTVDSVNCNAWNHSGERMAGGSLDGCIHIFDSHSQFACTFKWKVPPPVGDAGSALQRSTQQPSIQVPPPVGDAGSALQRSTQQPSIQAHDSSIVKLVWGPPEYGDVIACCCMDGAISLWEEAGEDTGSCNWRLCNRFQDNSVPVLDIQLGNCVSGLKLVAAYGDGHAKVYELLDPLELKRWQLQAEFQNVSNAVQRFEKCSSLTASIAWKSSTNATQQPTFILGFNSNLPYFNVPKIWEFMEVHQHWHPTAEFVVPGEDADQVYAISWAPNIGRPYELIAISGSKGVSIWHIELGANTNERPKLTRVATLSGHDGEVWQLDWDMGGMTLATSGNDGTVRLWQSNTNGVWQEVAVIESSQ